MTISAEHQKLAQRLGVKQQPGQSDADFVRWLENLRRHIALVRKAREYGVEIKGNMTTSAELRTAICQRLLVLLKEKGFSIDAKIKLGDRIVQIKKIVSATGRNPSITVHYWIISPWTRTDNKGRANHRPAEEILKLGTVAR